MTTRFLAPTAALLSLGLLAGCGALGTSKPSAVAELKPTAAISPNPTTGKATFTALDHGVRVAIEVRGLAPNSEHGFHIHEKGDCAKNGDAAGGHFNPGGSTHGKFGGGAAHGGDLPSLTADANGVARFTVDAHGLSLTEGEANNIAGRALIVHRDRDDGTTQPTGNSGPRIACAIITRS